MRSARRHKHEQRHDNDKHGTRPIRAKQGLHPCQARPCSAHVELKKVVAKVIMINIFPKKEIVIYHTPYTIAFSESGTKQERKSHKNACNTPKAFSVRLYLVALVMAAGVDRSTFLVRTIVE